MGVCNTANSNVTFMIMQLHFCLGMKIAIFCLLGSNIRSQEGYFADTKLGTSYLKKKKNAIDIKTFFKKNCVLGKVIFGLIPPLFILRFQIIFLLETQKDSVMSL